MDETQGSVMTGGRSRPLQSVFEREGGRKKGEEREKRGAVVQSSLWEEGVMASFFPTLFLCPSSPCSLFLPTRLIPPSHRSPPCQSHPCVARSHGVCTPDSLYSPSSRLSTLCTSCPLHDPSMPPVKVSLPSLAPSAPRWIVSVSVFVLETMALVCTYLTALHLGVGGSIDLSREHDIQGQCQHLAP